MQRRLNVCHDIWRNVVQTARSPDAPQCYSENFLGIVLFTKKAPIECKQPVIAAGMKPERDSHKADVYPCPIRHNFTQWFVPVDKEIAQKNEHNDWGGK